MSLFWHRNTSYAIIMLKARVVELNGYYDRKTFIAAAL